MHRIRGTFGYANVVSTLCLVLLLGGGTAYAATQLLPKNSVGTAQIKQGAVTPAKLSPAAKRSITGPTGPQGPKGGPGPKGEIGPRGEAGQRGDAGAKADTGPQGDPGVKGETGSQGVPGPKGDAGAKGETGLQGTPGPKGDIGADGDPGLQGDPGPKGDTGAEGEKGDQGDQGDVGPIGPSDVYSAHATLKSVNPASGNVTVVSLSLPAGNYLVAATQTAESEEGGRSTIECDIVVGASSQANFYARIGGELSGTLADQVTIALGTTTTVSEQCASTEHVMDLSEPTLTAIKVGTLH
jgi:hypothetical protein